MLVFGRDHLYASHLPLYRGPHAAQVILELEIDASIMQAYRAEFAAEPLATLEPERFDLGRLAPGNEHPVTEFTGTLYRGHFERGGQPWRRDVSFRVVRVLVFRTLAATASDSRNPTYFAFGAGDETFLARKIGGRPDCDQISELSGPAPLEGLAELSDVAMEEDSAAPCPKRPLAILAARRWRWHRLVYEELADLQ
jgi:hypothetical protein